MNQIRLFALVSAFVLAAGNAQAQAPAAAGAAAGKAYRCVDEKGRTLYTDSKTDARCKTVRIDPPPGGASPKPAAKAPPPRKSQAVKQAAAEPRTRKTHCAAIARASADFAKGKTGGLDRNAASQRQASIDKEYSKSCSDPSAPLDD